MLKRGSVIFTLISLLVLLYFYNRGPDRKYLQRQCKQERSLEFDGVVEKIKQDSFNHPTSTIYFTNGYVYAGIDKFTYGLWIDLNTDDSIVKRKNTNQYIIYKGGSPYSMDTFGNDVDCNSL